MSLICLPSTVRNDLSRLRIVESFFKGDLPETKASLTYLRKLVIWLIDSTPPTTPSTWNAFRHEMSQRSAATEQHPMFWIMRDMLRQKWGPPPGRNHLHGWVEFGAALHAIYVLTHENLHRTAVDAVVAGCVYFDEFGYHKDGIVDRDGSRLIQDHYMTGKWKAYKQWADEGAFDSVGTIVAIMQEAVISGGQKLKTLLAVLQALPTPPGHTLKKDRDSQQREVAAAEVAAREAAVANGGDGLDADFGEVTYEPAGGGRESGEVTYEPAESGGEDDGRVSPVLKIGIPAYDQLLDAPAPVEGPSLLTPVLERTMSFAIEQPTSSALGKRKAAESPTSAEDEAKHAKHAHMRAACAHTLAAYALELQGIDATGPRLYTNLAFAGSEVLKEAAKLLGAAPATTDAVGGGPSA